MWIKKSEYEKLHNDIDELRKEITDLKEKRNELFLNQSLILDHLKMTIVEEPAISSRKVIITQKEAKKRKSPVKNLSPLDNFFNSQRNLHGSLFPGGLANQYPSQQPYAFPRLF